MSDALVYRIGRNLRGYTNLVFCWRPKELSGTDGLRRRPSEMVFWQINETPIGTRSMTTEEIQQYIDRVLRAKFDGLTVQSGEMMTSEGGDGRFFGKVIASLYSGLPRGEELYLAIGQTEKETQIIKFGNSECLKPSETELDMLLLKELEIELPAQE